ncbi:hypothetical protein HanRHA438_Chr14g0682141 [Helianthus annuus]|nr:hypothetical protein HanRHA438_Chr14g0682141 [Helianthus annuus]
MSNVELPTLKVPKVADRTRNLGVRKLPAVKASKRMIPTTQLAMMIADMR